MAKTLKTQTEHVDPETGEVTTYPEAIEDAEIIPEAEAADASDVPAAEGGEPAAEPVAVEATGGGAAGHVADIETPPHVHAYDAGEFHPELHKLEGQMRDFMLTRIKNNWKPWQQMTVDEQQDLVNAIEMQARDTIRGTVRALNDYEWPHCMVTLGQVTIKGAEKGIEGKISTSMDPESLAFLGQHVEKRVMIVVTDAEAFFGADRVKYDGRGSQMDLPLGGSVKDVEAGGFEAETAALQDLAAAEELEDEHAQDDHPADAPVLSEGDAPEAGEAWDAAPWPDDEQLGERETDDDSADTSEPAEA